MNNINPITSSNYKFDHIIATGGIGSGIFYLLEGNDTLGRNESRMAVLQPWKDFCKQHIILHYVSVLLGATPLGKFSSYPIGKVGNDAAGLSLMEMMQNAGMDTAGVNVSPDQPTLFSVCFQYADTSGGNITSSNSASAQLGARDIEEFFEKFAGRTGRGIVLAVPEVPMDARMALLQEGRRRNYFNIAAVQSGEVNEFRNTGAFELIDLISLNIDEATSVAGLHESSAKSPGIVDACVRQLRSINPGISVMVTDGRRGSYCCYEGEVLFTPALEVDAVSAAGAGDAFLAGTIVGICCGMPLAARDADSKLIDTAVQLGNLLAAMSVTSPDTINLNVNAASLVSFAASHGLKLSPGNKFLHA